MNIASLSSIISAATNGVNQVAGYISEKLGPVTEKVITVIARQIQVDLWSNLVYAILFGALCYFMARLAKWCHTNTQTVASRYKTDAWEVGMVASIIVGVVVGVATIVCSLIFIITAPTIIFNPDYALAEKVLDLVQKIK